MGKKQKPSKELRKKLKETGNPAVVFSFDGTFMDTEPAIYATYRHMFAKFGGRRRFNPDQESVVIGQPTVKMLSKFFPKEDPKELLKEFRMYQSYHLWDLIQPMPGVEDFLKWLKKHDYPVAIISSRSRAMIVNMLEHAGLSQYVDVIIASSQKEHEFTTTESLYLVSKMLKKKCVIFIGHTPGHITSGHLVGAFTIAYNSNPKMLYDIIEAGPDFVTADYKEIKKLLKSEPLWVAYEIMKPSEEEDTGAKS